MKVGKGKFAAATGVGLALALAFGGAGCGAERGGEAHEHVGVEAAAHEGRGHAAAEAPSHEGHDHEGEAAAHEGHDHEAAPAAASSSDRLMCGEHNVYEDECGICHPELASSLAPGRGVKVRLPASDSADLIGVRTALPEAGRASDGIPCLAELVFDENKLAEIVAPVGGIVRSVSVDLGARAGRGALLAEIWSPEIAETAAEAVLSHQRLAREQKLHADGITPSGDLEEAEAAHRAVCQKARTFGFGEEDVARMAEHPEDAVYLEVRAPFAGEIIERSAVPGERIEAGAPLFLLADRASIWAMLAIPETGLAGVRVGQAVEIEVDAFPGRTFEGELTWIAARVDETTRLVRARAELPNPDGLLRDRMFARGRIVTRAPAQALLLPSDAVQKVDGRSLVFVKLEPDLYEARAVYLGADAGGRREVLVGLSPNEEIVVERSFALKSQLLASRLGAGCADD